mmetsp:Transcript_61181/g.146156  ORF Transcript_61181/g.146156 Transcript_61181/m.146156 type:complete len:115 (+) Transcript_61181:107-451(+)
MRKSEVSAGAVILSREEAEAHKASAAMGAKTPDAKNATAAGMVAGTVPGVSPAAAGATAPAGVGAPQVSARKRDPEVWRRMQEANDPMSENDLQAIVNLVEKNRPEGNVTKFAP